MSNPNFRLDGRTALVTGASSGIGHHFAATLAEAGAEVIATARRIERLETLVAELRARGFKAHALALDVTDPASVAACVEKAVALAGPIDVLVNNAGIADVRPAIDTGEADWRRVLDTNLDGAWRMAQACARTMLASKRGGSIINIASILGLRVSVNLLAYEAAKAALIQVTKALALEWARYGIRVNAICPGYIHSEINAGLFDTEAGQAMIKRVPQRRVGDPKELDGALLLLATDAGSYMTGSIVVVDGGHVVNSL
jgi:NAD(P)-dependent dehydrogenase (short-subunit alcohol dehydrogenase family)